MSPALLTFAPVVIERDEPGSLNICSCQGLEAEVDFLHEGRLSFHSEDQGTCQVRCKNTKVLWR